MRQLILVMLIAIFSKPVLADSLEGEYLYRVTTVRAQPGTFETLLENVAALRASDYFAVADIAKPMIMRHSQGDHWDLLVLTPMNSWVEYFSADAVSKRTAANSQFAELWQAVTASIAFSEDNFAYGPALKSVQSEFADNGFFHIEMFAAVAGKTDELMQQRRMENNYLAATDLKPNMIFRRSAGSDIDVFTIGFHKDIEAFAAPSQQSDDARQQAARDAGFKDRADISFYLRALISSHHDTLASKVD